MDLLVLTFNKCFTCALLCVDVVFIVVADRLLRQDSVPGGAGFERPGDSWDVGQFGRRAGQRGRPTLQQELPVVDNSGTCRWRNTMLVPVADAFGKANKFQTLEHNVYHLV